MENLDFARFVDWAFLGGLSATVLYVAKSINTLNVQIAQVLERITFHEKELGAHEERIQSLERKPRKH
jgi:DNA repair ATPase RecN